LRAILRDYFGLNWEPPVYNEVDFERRFRVPRSVFLRIYNAVKDRPFFAQRINATGRLQAHPLQKAVAAFRVIAYVEAPDRTDEYVRLSASTIAMSVRELMRFIVDEFGPSYLRASTPEELQRILTRNAERGMPGCMGSLNCSHWEWRNCPKAFAGMYQNHHEKRSVVMETVCDEDLWIWHLFVGCPGSHNDLNVLHVSPIYLSVTKGEWPPRTFSYTAKGTTPTLLYYLVDGIDPRIAFFVSPFPDPTTEVEVTFNRLQEAMREDVERLYAVLTARFHVAFHPAKYSTVEQMVTVTKAVAILHNMVTEKRRDGYVSRTRMAAGGQAAGGGGAAGDTGAHGSAAGATGDGNGRAAAAGSDASAGGDLVAERDAGVVVAAAAAAGGQAAGGGGASGPAGGHGGAAGNAGGGNGGAAAAGGDASASGDLVARGGAEGVASAAAATGRQAASSGGAAAPAGEHGGAAGNVGDGNRGAAAACRDASAGGDLVAGGGAGGLAAAAAAAGGQAAGGGETAGDTGAHGGAAGDTGGGNGGAAAAGGNASTGGDLVAGGGAGGVAAAAAAVGVSEAVSGGAEGMQEDGDGLVRGGDPPSAIAPAIVHVFWQPVGTFGQALGAWAETRSEEEHLKRRYDLVEDVWVDRAPLLEPYL